MEPEAGFLEKARVDLKDNEKVGEFYLKGMQEMNFDYKYDCIWIQWVIGHLTDDDLIIFMKKCKEALTPNVFIS